jgi:hypothetical protein
VDVAFEEMTHPGWSPVIHLATLAARLFGGRFLRFPLRHPGAAERLIGLRRRPRGRAGTLLVMLRGPGDIYKLRALPMFRAGYEQVVVWVFDSFWTDHMPLAAALRDIDLIVVIRADEMAAWNAVAPGRVIALPWGADALRLGRGAGARGTDVLRVGRQPPAWDDDAATAVEAAQVGLRFRGRPPLIEDPPANQAALTAAYGDARFIVAFSNRVAPAPYTHPRTEYLTGRWTEALACGATVAGIAPMTDSAAASLLWPGATLEFDRVDRTANLAALRAACDGWTEAQAIRNHRMALERLDWRWRLATLAERLGLDPPGLRAELAELRQAAAR